jgi:hypothetical protein
LSREAFLLNDESPPAKTANQRRLRFSAMNIVRLASSRQNLAHASLNCRMQSAPSLHRPEVSEARIGITVSIAHFQ